MLKKEYIAPCVETFEARVEKGFNGSGAGNNGTSGIGFPGFPGHGQTGNQNADGSSTGDGFMFN